MKSLVMKTVCATAINLGLAVSVYTPAAASEIIFTMDHDGDVLLHDTLNGESLSINDKALPIASLGQNKALGNGPLGKFLRGLGNQFENARLALCAMPLRPQELIMRFGIRLEWAEKVVCSKSAEKAFLRIDADSELTRNVQFKSPVTTRETDDGDMQYFAESLVNGEEIQIPKKKAQSLQAKFVNQIANIFCAFPIRPSILRIRMGAAEPKWKMGVMCAALEQSTLATNSK